MSYLQKSKSRTGNWSLDITCKISKLWNVVLFFDRKYSVNGDVSKLAQAKENVQGSKFWPFLCLKHWAKWSLLLNKPPRYFFGRCSSLHEWRLPNNDIDKRQVWIKGYKRGGKLYLMISFRSGSWERILSMLKLSNEVSLQKIENSINLLKSASILIADEDTARQR